MNDSSSSQQDRTRQALRQHGKRLPRDLAQLADAVWKVEDDAMEHAACLEFLPAYIRAEVNGEPVAQLYPKIKHHLDRCESCSAEYVVLLELALADARGQLPLAPAMSPPDLSFLPSGEPPETWQPEAFNNIVLQVARAIVKRISPQNERSVDLLAPPFFEQVQDRPRFILESGGLQALLGSGAREPGLALTTLAASYASAKSIQDQITANQISIWSREGTLQTNMEARALASARQINLDPDTASQFAHEFATQFSADPTLLHRLLE